MFLISVDDNSNYYLQIADQSGKPLDLPKEERKVKRGFFVITSDDNDNSQKEEQTVLIFKAAHNDPISKKISYERKVLIR